MSATLLSQEWVEYTLLRHPPPPPPPNWMRYVQLGETVDLLHDGGWWPVVVRQRRQQPARAGDGCLCLIAACGYAVKERWVPSAQLRPRGPA